MAPSKSHTQSPHISFGFLLAQIGHPKAAPPVFLFTAQAVFLSRPDPFWMGGTAASRGSSMPWRCPPARPSRWPARPRAPGRTMRAGTLTDPDSDQPKGLEYPSDPNQKWLVITHFQRVETPGGLGRLQTRNQKGRFATPSKDYHMLSFPQETWRKRAGWQFVFLRTDLQDSTVKLGEGSLDFM